MFSYRNLWLEIVCKKQLYKVLDNYLSDGPSDGTSPHIVITPSDFASILSFLLAFDQLYLDLKYISKFSNFVGNIRTSELCFIVKGLDSAIFKLNGGKRGSRKSLEIVSEVCSMLEEECALRLMKREESEVDLTLAWRLISVIRKMKGDTPLLDVALKTFTSHDTNITQYHSREIKDAMQCLMQSNALYPEAIDVISKYIFKNLEHLNPEMTEKFLNLTYSLGWERNNDESMDFEKLAKVIES
jgi:hypothetical protein